MRGFPKTLNTKSDYLYVKDNFPKEHWAPAFQALLDTMKDWFFVRYLEEGEASPKGDQFKVVDPQENSSEQRKALYEFKDSPTAKIHQLGFSVSEINSYLKE